MKLTHERLLQVLRYDPTTGVFTWLDSGGRRRVQVGADAGYVTARGYRTISVDGAKIRAHRIAWFYMTGRWPAAEVDHRNGMRDDNRWSNLREATHAQNAQNRKPRAGSRSGVCGVSWSHGEWHAVIQKDGNQRSLGRFPPDQLAQAVATRRQAEAELFSHRRAA